MKEKRGRGGEGRVGEEEREEEAEEEERCSPLYPSMHKMSILKSKKINRSAYIFCHPD